MTSLRIDHATVTQAAVRLDGVHDHWDAARSAFTSRAEHLGAFGAMGELLGAATDVRNGMHEIADHTTDLNTEWQALAGGVRDVLTVFGELDQAHRDALSQTPRKG